MATSNQVGQCTEWVALRRLREEAGHTITSLALAARLSQPHLSQVEAGKRGITRASARRLARVLGVPLEDLLASRPKVPPRGRARAA